ncbi:Sec-independent protein translocase protein TatB [Nitrincola alkalisediminis]|uniref:Sec-independent protein translocase protein TatB n=1 Tax=Nitrincola alkalisediminis TaxID=1366656 RepID=UPI001875ADA2|nr:Sec-independent protein translocase protein TatB [Nitrincola alkalisediminis]
MFDIGFAEILIVSVVALLVLGPEKLPTAVRTCGLWLGRIKRSVSAIQSEISEELRIEELRRTTAISKEQLEKELKEMRQPFNAASQDVSKTVEEAAKAVDTPDVASNLQDNESNKP